MARSSDITNGIVKIQALIRGHIVRKRFLNLREEYDRLFTSLEGSDDVAVTWKTSDKPCLPTVCRKQPQAAKKRDNVLKAKSQTNENKDFPLQSHFEANQASRGSPEAEISEIQSNCVHNNGYDLTGKTIDGGNNDMVNQVPNKDFNSLVCCEVPNNFDHIGSKNTAIYENSVTNDKNMPNVSKNLVENKLVKCKSENSRDVNSTKLAKSGTYLSLSEQEVKEVEGNVWSDGIPKEYIDVGVSQKLGASLDTYPKDKTELVKLQEELKMELLWLHQAIESRKSYLLMKENLKETK